MTDARKHFAAEKKTTIPHLLAIATPPSIRLARWEHSTCHGEPLQTHVPIIQARAFRFLGQAPLPARNLETCRVDISER